MQPSSQRRVHGAEFKAPVLAAHGADAEAVGAVAGEPSAVGAEQIHIELRRGNAQLMVRWPSSQARECVA